MINGLVLVLNKSFFPIHVTTVRRAIRMVYGGAAKVVDDDYQTFDFHAWVELEVEGEEFIGMISGDVRIPRVIIVARFNRTVKHAVRFSRSNVLLRDNFTCQYCRRRFPKSQLNLDHVLPRSRGGRNSWENVVASCIPCNLRKGNRTPQEAKMYLLKIPHRPKSLPMVGANRAVSVDEQWKPFIGAFNFACYKH